MLMSEKYKKRIAGFTILELMIAAMAFSVVLLVIAAGVISVTNAYYKGVISSQTQATARAIMDELSQAVEYSQGINPSLVSGNVKGICIDNTLYAYYPGIEVTDNISLGDPDSAHQGHQGLIAISGAGCMSEMPAAVPLLFDPLPGAPTLTPGYRELLGQHMRISDLSVTQLVGTGLSNAWQIHVRIIYGDDSLLTQQPVSTGNLGTELCRSASGQQFCAVSDLTTIVQQRLL